ncbi:MAG: NUDIX hydrolase [Bacteroidetes bacterium]|nr:NUDIX hydrolase [Bacteroidota bacterium]
MALNPWKTVSIEKQYDNEWIEVSESKVITPNGKDGIYGVVHFKNYAIGILPIDNEHNTWLVGQYRFPIKTFSWEIPEGGGDLKIEPLESAKRELLEETGIEAAKWTKIHELHTSNSATDEFGILFLAQDLTFHDPHPDDTEKITVKKLPFNEAYEMAIHGEITDALSLIAIFKAKILIDEYKI